MLTFHVTPTINIPSILERGLVISTPKDMEAELKAVYLFPDYDSMENAVINWFGDRFDADIPLSLLTIDSKNLILSHNDVGYEVLSFNTIPPETIVKVESLE